MMTVMNRLVVDEDLEVMAERPTALITGASTGIGAAYADRFARRGHDLVLASRDLTRLEALAARLRAEHGVEVEVIKADLTNGSDLRLLEKRLADDARISVLVNNAGASLAGRFPDQTPDQVADLIQLNVVALARLTSAVTPRFLKAGSGSIVNVASVVGLAPEMGMSVYGATKAFVTYLSQGLQGELGPRGVYVQAVLPAATRTEIWGKTGQDVDKIPGVMALDDLIDAAMTGYDRREAITIPPLHDAGQWDAYEAARRAMLPGFGQSQPAPRYTVAG